jgi:hypothetical protein
MLDFPMCRPKIPPPPLVYLATCVVLGLVLIVAVVDIFVAHSPSTLRQIVQGATLFVVLGAIGALASAFEERRQWVSRVSADALALTIDGGESSRDFSALQERL